MNDKRFLKLADNVAIWASVLVIALSSGVIVKGCFDMCRQPAEKATAPVVIEEATPERLYYLATAEESAAVRGGNMPSVPERKQKAEPAMVYLGRFKVTGYDVCVECCGKTDGITASGTQATLGRTVAAGPELPFGTVLYIDGIGERVVEDRGTGVTEGCLDVLCEDHAECYAITGWYDVYIIEEG